MFAWGTTEALFIGASDSRHVRMPAMLYASPGSGSIRELVVGRAPLVAHKCRDGRDDVPLVHLVQAVRPCI